MKRKILRRTGMLFLFIGAIYTTTTTISNITLTDMKTIMEDNFQGTVVEASSHLENREISLTKKELNNVTKEQRYISSVETEEARTLEEAIDFKQYESINVIATGYTAGVESTGKTPDHPEYGITYSGIEVKRDLYSTIAADLNVYPIGTIMYIPGYGYGVVADKGGAITGNKIDLYYETVEDVYSEWGKKKMEVYVIKMGDGELTEEQLVKLNENETLQVFRDQFINK